ncbi:MAG: response regulator [Hyphomonas sp.]
MIKVSAQGRRWRIAVVDDNEAVRRSLLLLLGARGYQVDVFHSGDALFQMIGHSPYDCFVIDLKLGGPSGVSVLVTLRRMGVTGPAILISGWDDPKLEEFASRHGFAALVRKPMFAKSIADTLEDLLAAARSPQSYGFGPRVPGF